MKKVFLLTIIFISTVVAKEGSMCHFYYDAVERKATIIDSYGSDLSKLAEKKLYNDLRYETGECISQCEGTKFSYCNKIAKKIESF